MGHSHASGVRTPNLRPPVPRQTSIRARGSVPPLHQQPWHSRKRIFPNLLCVGLRQEMMRVDTSGSLVASNLSAIPITLTLHRQPLHSRKRTCPFLPCVGLRQGRMRVDTSGSLVASNLIALTMTLPLHRQPLHSRKRTSPFLHCVGLRREMAETEQRRQVAQAQVVNQGIRGNQQWLISASQQDIYQEWPWQQLQCPRTSQ